MPNLTVKSRPVSRRRIALVLRGFSLSWSMLLCLLMFPARANCQVQMSADEYAAYNAAKSQTSPAAAVAAWESYLSAYPSSAVKLDVLNQILYLYVQNDSGKALPTAARILQLDPDNLRALTYSVYYLRLDADASADPLRKRELFEQMAGLARRGLAASKPANLSEADFRALQTAVFPTFYSAIGDDAMNRRDTAAAIQALRTEIDMAKPSDTAKPGTVLQDIYVLAKAYYTSPNPDYVNCAFYATRAAIYAPSYASQIQPLATYCYKKYHGSIDGYEAVQTAARDNIHPPPGFYIKPAPSPADIVAELVNTTPDLARLALSDKEFVFQYGRPPDAERVWQSIKGKHVQVPNVVVTESSSTAIKVAVTEEAIKANAADFTFNLRISSDRVPSVGARVTLNGVYDSFNSDPLMITMSDGEVVSATAYTAVPNRDIDNAGIAPPAPASANHQPSVGDPISTTASRGFSRSPPNAVTAHGLPIPHNYALIFATDNYLHWPHLQNPIADADALGQTLNNLFGFEVDEVKDPTGAQILAKLTEYLHRKFEPQDQLLIFFSGHGYFDPDLGQGFIVPSDALRAQDDFGNMHMLAHDVIMRYVNRIQSQHVVLILDACFAGTLDRRIADSGVRGDTSSDIYSHATLDELLLRKEAKRTRRYFASGGKDFVPDGLPGHHSPFMSALLVSLNQAADRKGYATLDDLQQGLNTVNPEPRWGDIQNDNEPGADFILLTAAAIRSLRNPN